MANPSTIDVWIKRAVWVSVAALLSMSCFFVWRVSRFVSRMETLFAATSADIRQVTGTAAAIARRADQIDDRLGELDRRLTEVVPVTELTNALDDLAEVQAHDDVPERSPDTATEKEISHLFERISRSHLSFAYSEKTRSATSFRIHLYAKYRLYRKVVASTEDFIAKVATKTAGGNPYYVVLPDGGEQELSVWLSEGLREYRSGSTDSPATTRSQ